MRYFQKELVATPLYLPTGGKLVFSDAGNDMGVLATADPFILAELDKLMAQHRGGVSEVTAEEFMELKKKYSSSKPSLTSSALKAQVLRQAAQPAKKEAVAAEVKAVAPRATRASQPLEVPDLMPLVGQMWRPEEAV